MDWLRRLLGKASVEPPMQAAHFIYVMLPEPLDPMTRGERYQDPLDAELRLAQLGGVSGGGTALSAPDDEDERSIEYCGVDVDTDDLTAARALLRDHLPDLGCWPGTRLEFREDGVDLCDIYDGERWTIGVESPAVETDD